MNPKDIAKLISYFFKATFSKISCSKGGIEAEFNEESESD